MSGSAASQGAGCNTAVNNAEPATAVHKYRGDGHEGRQGAVTVSSVKLHALTDTVLIAGRNFGSE
jgi:hypothetical protein